MSKNPESAHDDCRTPIYRVSSDLENLEMSGNFDARGKSQGIFQRQEKSGKVKEFHSFWGLDTLYIQSCFISNRR